MHIPLKYSLGVKLSSKTKAILHNLVIKNTSAAGIYRAIIGVGKDFASLHKMIEQISILLVPPLKHQARVFKIWFGVFLGVICRLTTIRITH